MKYILHIKTKDTNTLIELLKDKLGESCISERLVSWTSRRGTALVEVTVTDVRPVYDWFNNTVGNGKAPFPEGTLLFFAEARIEMGEKP